MEGRIVAATEKYNPDKRRSRIRHRWLVDPTPGKISNDLPLYRGTLTDGWRFAGFRVRAGWASRETRQPNIFFFKELERTAGKRVIFFVF